MSEITLRMSLETTRAQLLRTVLGAKEPMSNLELLARGPIPEAAQLRYRYGKTRYAVVFVTDESVNPPGPGFLYRYHPDPGVDPTRYEVERHAAQGGGVWIKVWDVA